MTGQGDPHRMFAEVRALIRRVAVTIVCHPGDVEAVTAAAAGVEGLHIDVVESVLCSPGRVVVCRPTGFEFELSRVPRIERTFDKLGLTPDPLAAPVPTDGPTPTQLDGRTQPRVPSTWLSAAAWSDARRTLARSFVYRYARRSNRDVADLARRRYRVALCECEYPDCQGFRLLSDTPLDFDPAPGVPVAELFLLDIPVAPLIPGELTP